MAAGFGIEIIRSHSLLSLCDSIYEASWWRLYCESYDICCQNTAGFLLTDKCQPRRGLALTNAMSKDLAGDGIRVNTVCIGKIRSDQLEKAWKREAPELTWDEYASDARHAIPLGRIGHAEEAANVIAFLSSQAASYVTGTSVNIDGGKGEAL